MYFRNQELESTNLLAQDPIVAVRGRPFYPEDPGMGPHDVLGFRNQRVPKVVDSLLAIARPTAITSWQARIGRGN